jgi:hypothetical protein
VTVGGGGRVGLSEDEGSGGQAILHVTMVLECHSLVSCYVHVYPFPQIRPHRSPSLTTWALDSFSSLRLVRSTDSFASSACTAGNAVSFRIRAELLCIDAMQVNRKLQNPFLFARKSESPAVTDQWILPNYCCWYG